MWTKEWCETISLGNIYTNDCRDPLLTLFADCFYFVSLFKVFKGHGVPL